MFRPSIFVKFCQCKSKGRWGINCFTKKVKVYTIEPVCFKKGYNMKLIFKITLPVPSSTVASVTSSGYAPVAPMAPVGQMAPVASTAPTTTPFGYPPFGVSSSHGRGSTVSSFPGTYMFGSASPFPPSNTHGRLPPQPSSHVVSSSNASFFGSPLTPASMVYGVVSSVIAKYSELSLGSVTPSSSDPSMVEVELNHPSISSVTPDQLVKDFNEALRHNEQISLVNIYEDHNYSHTHGRGH